MTVAPRRAPAEAPPPHHPTLSVIVPTRNERQNVAALLAALAPALAGIDAELLVVDDSSDGTAAEFARRAAEVPFAVRVACRDPQDRSHGLGAAVVRGFAAAAGDYLCVMDADLQHPPALVGRLLDAARRDGAEVVVASRYIPGGSAGGLTTETRLIVSRGFGLLARALFPRCVGPVRDPMSGYFIVRRSVLAGTRLRPIGYKILLEVLVRCRPRRVRELPYRMAPRRAGRSKAGLRQGIDLLRHLVVLRLRA